MPARGFACYPRDVKRVVFALLVPVVVLLAWAAGPPAAHADTPSQWRIPRYDVVATIDRSGTTAVKLDFDFDFGSEPGHGPYITLPLQQEIGGDPDHWRMLDVVVGQVTSPSGANAETLTREEGGNLLIRVGNENKTFTGRQRYTISYTIRGLIAPRQAVSGLDEFNWNVVGSSWEVPFNLVTVRITGPVAVTRTACFTGSSFEVRCDRAENQGGAATFRQSGLSAGDPLQVVAGFPAGTFVGAEARLTKRYHIGNMFPLTPVTGGITAVLTALGLWTVFRRTRRSARDEVYLGLTPGVLPAAGSEAQVGPATVEAPVAVQFTPPRGARPGEVGTLVDATANNVDITATVIDLAVRGHMKITPLSKKDWEFQRLRSPEQLTSYENHLLSTLFKQGGTVTTDDLKQKSYASLLTGTRERLYQRVSKELRWFKTNPVLVRAGAVGAGVGLILVGAGVGYLLGFLGLGLIGLAGVLTGLAVLVMNGKFGRRTALGSAMLAQAKGFQLYLTTAEADQIKFEEGIDVFSRYLPYAIVFGVAERWARVFEQLAAQGRYTPDTTWYGGTVYGPFPGSAFASSLDRLAGTMSSAMQSATAASSGGSGFSGGGGFGGGGGGGW